ncbi:MAG: SRPBCC family protein [bacterium]
MTETRPSTAFTYTHNWTLDDTPERVFRALTEPDELTQWFAENVQIEPRVNGVYRFWGRHTLGTPPHDAARQTITRFEPNSALAFSWPINEVDTDVTITLEPLERGTKVTLTHDVSGDLRTPRPHALIDDHWRLAIANLSAYLSGGMPIMPDYFDQTPELRITMAIDAPPSTVFRALTESQALNSWMGAKSAGRPTTILEMIPVEKLVLGWPDWRGDESVADQKITFLLAPGGKDGTTLTFAHAGFGRTTDMSDYRSSWEGFFGALKKEVAR